MMTIDGLRKRAVLLQGLRSFFIDRDFIEVDTPLRIPAPAPEVHISPEPAGEWFLQASPELCMKRLLAQGVERIFQICKSFRQQERGDKHLPEFTMLEWYRTGADYQDLMNDCEELIRELAGLFGFGTHLPVAHGRVDLSPGWEKLSVAEAFERYAPYDMHEALKRNVFDEALVLHIEPQLGKVRPTFLYDYPAALGALARIKASDPMVAERFELYISGLELANGFSELTDVREQRARFEEDRRQMQRFGRTPGPMPESFLRDLQNMPEAAGIALGVDRLVMLFLGLGSVDEAVAFTPEEL